MKSKITVEMVDLASASAITLDEIPDGTLFTATHVEAYPVDGIIFYKRNDVIMSIDGRYCIQWILNDSIMAGLQMITYRSANGPKKVFGYRTYDAQITLTPR